MLETSCARINVTVSETSADTRRVAIPTWLLLISETTLHSARPHPQLHVHRHTLRVRSWLLTSDFSPSPAWLYTGCGRHGHDAHGTYARGIWRALRGKCRQTRFRVACVHTDLPGMWRVANCASRKGVSGFQCRCTPARLRPYHPMEFSNNTANASATHGSVRLKPTYRGAHAHDVHREGPAQRIDCGGRRAAHRLPLVRVGGRSTTPLATLSHRDSM